MDKEIFKRDAKTIVDLSFNNKLFKDEVTRDDMDKFEDLLSYLLQSKYESYKRAEELLKKLKN
jgi:hypothetical protein